MKKILAKIAIVATMTMPLVASAALPNWDITGTWTFNDIWEGTPYVHTMMIDTFDPITGAFSGTGFYNADPALTWSVTGVESGNDITVFNLLVETVAPGVTIMGTGTIDPSGTLMSGQGYQSNLPGVDPNIEWTATGTATEITNTLVVVSDDTSLGENHPGWMFARDPSNATPFEFNPDQNSIGSGSLYVKPIGATAAHKFIGENFINAPVADVNYISYDFMIGTGGVDTQEEQFYMNVYANFGQSDDLKFYDCRYDVVPTVGSTAGFTTVTFDPTQAYPVTTRGGATPSPFTCPAVPADMDLLSEGSNIRAFNLNVGDTSASDVGLDGYLDNVVVVMGPSITTYDFEPENDGPITSLVVTSPIMPNNGQAFALTANVDDSTTGGSNIKSAEYSTDGGTTWLPMDAVSNPFDAVSEDVTAQVTISNPGTYSVCVRGTDEFDNVGDSVCIDVVVLSSIYTGGGNIKIDGKVAWTFGGNVGFLPDTGEPAGNFQVVEHLKKGTVACHFKEFENVSIDVNAKTATFTALNGKCTDGQERDLQVVAEDGGEPSDGVDSIVVSGGSWDFGGPLSGGNIQVQLSE